MDQTKLPTTTPPKKSMGSQIITSGHAERRTPFQRLWTAGVLLVCIGLLVAYEGLKWRLEHRDSVYIFHIALTMGHVMFLAGVMSLLGWWVLGDLVFEKTSQGLNK